MNDPRGSRWRKWDLHIHTPSSIHHLYGGNTQDTWDKFISALESLPEEIKVIGINDYIFIDGYRKVLAAKQAGRLKNIDLILPVIELRLDKFGGSAGALSRINFHVIFSDQIDPDIIENHFLNALTRHYKLSPLYESSYTDWKALPTRDSLSELGRKIIESVPPEERSKFYPPLVEGFNNINFHLETILEALSSHYFFERHITAVGKTEWWDIEWNDQSIADKKTIIHNAHWVFISAQSIADCIKAQASLDKSAVNSRLLDCSDAHSFDDANTKDRLGKCYTWIKADPTFEGLVHAYYEYKDRVYLGEKPNKVREVENNRTRYIQSISIQRKPTSTLDETWFDDCQIELNHDLIAIIGNKGAGKSALSDILGLLGNTKNDERFSFLSAQRFRSPNNNKSLHFQATLTWESGLTAKRELYESTDHNLSETIKYIPQGLFEDVCNEIASGAETNFDRELRKVIFSHVSAPDRLGKETLDELLTYRTEETYEAIGILKTRLNEINDEIYVLEEQLSSEHRMQLQDLLDIRRKELEAHESSKPQALLKPQEASEQDASSILERISELSGQLEMLKTKQASMQNLQEGSALFVSVADKLLERIENFQQQFQDFKSASLPELEQLGLEFEAVAKLTIYPNLVAEKREFHESQRRRADHQLDPHQPSSVISQSEAVQTEIGYWQDKLDEPNREYQKYQSALREWEIRSAEIRGDPSAIGSLEYYQHQLKELNELLPQKLEDGKAKRLMIVIEIYGKINTLAEVYRSLYQPVQKFIDLHPLARNELRLNFDVSIVNASLQERLFDWIGHNVMGSFYGRASGEKVLQEMLSRHSFDNEEGILAFLADLMEQLTHDKRLPDAPPVEISTQLKKGQTVTSLYNYIYSLDYLRPRYILKMGEKELSQLSPGERGALLLIFYLLIDKENIPLVIDQPEENLDNQTVYTLLVKCIKETKNKRQIIIVTHNPNLAVVCDAEQIICCAIDKQNGNCIEYISGSIENPVLNKKIVDILEGTKPAFDNRRLKYQSSTLRTE